MPVHVDWRTRFGYSWITSIRDQRPCNACVTFAYTALVESMTRIEHGFWTIRSEGDLHDGRGLGCNEFESFVGASYRAATDGIADPDCFAWPYSPGPGGDIGLPYHPSGDRSGRTVRMPLPTTLPTVEDQKRWLELVGPIVAHFELFEDFSTYDPTLIYEPGQGTSTIPNSFRGFHATLIVGYGDDARGGYWIGKNSWGSAWGDNGYFRIRFGVCFIDTIPKLGLRLTDPDPWTKRRLHNGGIVETGSGERHRDLALFTLDGDSVQHWRRQSSELPFSWEKLGPAVASGAAGRPAVIQSTHNRDIELVYREAGGGLRHRTFSQSARGWQDSGQFGPPNATGVPGFIQSNYVAPGSFEVVVATTSGNLVHLSRTNPTPKSATPPAWQNHGVIHTGVALSGPALVQSRAGVIGPRENGHGPLQLVCVLSTKMMQALTCPAAGQAWVAGPVFGAGDVETPPCMIESQLSTSDELQAGNLELCVAGGGQMQHWRREPTAGGIWQQVVAPVGDSIAEVIGLAQTSFAFRLEAIVRLTDGRLKNWVYDGGTWNDAGIVPANIVPANSVSTNIAPGGGGPMTNLPFAGLTLRQAFLVAAAAMFGYNGVQRLVGVKTGGQVAYNSWGFMLAVIGMLLPDNQVERPDDQVERR